MAHELLDGREGHALFVQDVRKGGPEPVVGDPLRQASGLQRPPDVRGGVVVGAGLSLCKPRADEAERPSADLSHLLEPGDHGVGNRHQGGITILRLVGNEDLPLEAQARPLHHPSLVFAHAHQQLSTNQEGDIHRPLLVDGFQESIQVFD